MEYLLIGIGIMVVILIGLWWLRQSITRQLSGQNENQAFAFMQNQINAMSQQNQQQMDQLRNSLQQINQQLTNSITATRKAMDDRLEGNTRIIQSVSKQLGQLDESSRRIFDIGKDISSLQQTLSAPKLRGNISELFLKDLLAQIFPPNHYRIQHTFKGGETVDAVVFLKAGMVPIDAKFPLENFKRLVETSDKTDGKKTARKQFIKDVKIHIDAIASKYIRTDEGTFDFALMYIPAENVYYETIIKDDDGIGDLSLFTYAIKKRVIPVSPNSFYAYLQTILLGLKGLRVEESARDIINRLGRLRQEFERFSEAFRLIGTHLDNSSKKFNEAEKRLGKLEGKMEQIDGVIKGIDSPEERVLTESN